MLDLASKACKDELEESIGEIFSSMIPLPLQCTGREEGIQHYASVEIIAVLGFTGSHAGSYVVATTMLGARKVTAALLMLDSPDDVSVEDSDDAMGELANMIGGSFKNHYVESGNTMELASPAVVHGKRLQGSCAKDAETAFTLFFQCDGEPLSVMFYAE